MAGLMRGVLPAAQLVFSLAGACLMPPPPLPPSFPEPFSTSRLSKIAPFNVICVMSGSARCDQGMILW